MAEKVSLRNTDQKRTSDGYISEKLSVQLNEDDPNQSLEAHLKLTGYPEGLSLEHVGIHIEPVGSDGVITPSVYGFSHIARVVSITTIGAYYSVAIVPVDLEKLIFARLDTVALLVARVPKNNENLVNYLPGNEFLITVEFNVPKITVDQELREAYASQIEGDSDNPERVAKANAILAGEHDDEVREWFAATPVMPEPVETEEKDLPVDPPEIEDASTETK